MKTFTLAALMAITNAADPAVDTLGAAQDSTIAYWFTPDTLTGIMIFLFMVIIFYLGVAELASV